nr:CpAvd43N76M protein [synthetic construct]
MNKPSKFALPLAFAAVTASGVASAGTQGSKESPLHGTQNTINKRTQPTFGFTVNWKFSESTTVFTGQCFIDRNGKEVLKTMWLLRSSVNDIGDDWKATRVGIMIFTRLRTQKEGGSGGSARKCSLTGKWTNDLGSNMTIGAVNSRGEFTGTYITAVT